jgi:hypothetical protein
MPRKKVVMTKREQLVQAVKKLNTLLQNREASTKDYFNGFEALFELIEQPWDVPLGELDPGYERAWREGYEQCMVDVVDAIADEWGVVVWMEG